jgi:protein ImuB
MSGAASERRILAIVLPELLEELASQRLFRAPEARTPRVEFRTIPRAVVLSDQPTSLLDPNARLDAVNAAARKLGVSTRHTLAQASARVGHLVLQALPPACVSQALQRVAEAALGFGAPVSFRAPDTIWVEVTGTRQLFGGERELALALKAHVEALGHAVRVAGAPGPWLAQSFARHADFDETGIILVEAARARDQSSSLPIGSLPISDESVAWFARLGLLNLADLRQLPRSALAARLDERGCERTLDLIDGRDDGVLAAYLPEVLPFEEQSWDFPLESVEPLLFVLKGLSSRLGSRLEGRGQAAHELLFTIRYDQRLAALHWREECWREEGSREAREGHPPEALELPFRLATPLSHAEDLERIVRTRLQKETLFAPASGVRLAVMAITEARQFQLSLGQHGADAGTGLGAMLSSDPRTLAVLMAELSADIGEGAVGLLETHDSHLLEKSSRFVPIHQRMDEGHAPEPAGFRLVAGAPTHERSHFVVGAPTHECPDAIARRPTRLVTPIEFKAPLREKEIVVLDRRAFVIEALAFEERLEAVEWWAPAPVSRDYFRLWLTSLSPTSSVLSALTASSHLRGRSEGMEVLVYLNRDDGKKYVQGLYD